MSDSTNISIYDPDAPMTIRFLNRDDEAFLEAREVIDETTKKRTKWEFTWGDNQHHFLDMNKLHHYLSNIVSPDLRDALLREIKVQMESDIKECLTRAFNLGEE